MPVVLRFGRFKFYIYPKDHAPPHVHVVAVGDGEAKFRLVTGECLAVYGFSKKTVNALGELIKNHQDLLMEAWKEYEGEE